MRYEDPDTLLDTLIKNPAEDRRYNIPFSQELRTGDTIASVVEVVFENMGKVGGSSDIAISSSVAFSDDTVQPRISAGQDQENYKITARVLTAGGDTLEVDVMLWVRD